MRKLATKDVFKTMRLIDKLNLKEELAPHIKEWAQSGRDVADVGIEGFLTIVEIASRKNTENAIYELLADVMGLTPSEVENLPINELARALEEIGRDNDLKSFFISLSGLIGARR